eukprot:SAG31_NODE_6395_length_2034_cov_3.668217_1_plen_269_part_00
MAARRRAPTGAASRKGLPNGRKERAPWKTRKERNNGRRSALSRAAWAALGDWNNNNPPRPPPPPPPHRTASPPALLEPSARQIFFRGIPRDVSSRYYLYLEISLSRDVCRGYAHLVLPALAATRRRAPPVDDGPDLRSAHRSSRPRFRSSVSDRASLINSSFLPFFLLEAGRALDQRATSKFAMQCMTLSAGCRSALKVGKGGGARQGLPETQSSRRCPPQPPPLSWPARVSWSPGGRAACVCVCLCVCVCVCGLLLPRGHDEKLQLC